MQTVQQKLIENLQLIYRKSVDADDLLNKLQQQGKGSFSHVFADDVGFQVKSKRFKPYVEELAQEVARLEQLDNAALQQVLPAVVNKIGQMFATLANFQQNLKA